MDKFEWKTFCETAGVGNAVITQKLTSLRIHMVINRNVLVDIIDKQTGRDSIHIITRVFAPQLSQYIVCGKYTKTIRHTNKGTQTINEIINKVKQPNIFTDIITYWNRVSGVILTKQEFSEVLLEIGRLKIVGWRSIGKFVNSLPYNKPTISFIVDKIFDLLIMNDKKEKLKTAQILIEKTLERNGYKHA